MQELIRYQDLDMKKRRIEQEILDCDDRKKAKEMQSKLKDLQSKLIVLEEKAQNVASQFDNQVNALEKLNSYVQIQKDNTENVDDSEVSAKISELRKLKESLIKLEKDILELQKAQEQILNDNDAIIKNATVANKNLGLYKDRYNAIKQNREPEVEVIIKEMSELSSKIDKTVLAKYKTISDSKPLPVIVPLKDGKCGGCRMEIPIAQINTLKQKGYTECENCGRIVYFQD